MSKNATETLEEKTPTPYEEWATTMAQLAANERLTYSLLNKFDQYMLTWGPFTALLFVTVT